MIYIGIDPGLSGGIAALNQNGEVTDCLKMPETDADVLAALRSILGGETSEGRRAVLEKVHAMPKQGVTSVFTFGKGYGALRMALAALEIPYDEVAPQRWQKALGCLTKGDKNVSKAKAQQLFPQVKVTHAVADALLLSEYCRRVSWRHNP